MAKKLKFQEYADLYFEYGMRMRKAGISWLKKELKKNPFMDFGKVDYQMTIDYDNGNGTMIGSPVWSLTLTDNNIYLELLENENYSIDNLSNVEVFELCEYIKNYYLEK